jgi:hypothetical protein
MLFLASIRDRDNTEEWFGYQDRIHRHRGLPDQSAQAEEFQIEQNLARRSRIQAVADLAKRSGSIFERDDGGL